MSYFNFALAAALAICLSAQPLRANPLDQAEAMVRANQPAQALATLAQVRETAGNQARLLWIRAAAHLQRREFRAALPLLERLVTAMPGEERFRLELGRALYETGQDDRARHHLTLARAGGVSPGEDRVIASYFNAMTRRQVTTGNFSFAIAPSANPGKRTDAEVIFIAGLPFTLTPEARAQPGTALRFGVGVVHRPTLGRDLRARLSFSANAEAYDTGADSSAILTGEAGLEWLGDRDRVFGVGLTIGRKIDQGTGDYTRAGGYFSYVATVGASSAVLARFELVRQHNHNRPRADGNRARFFAQYRHAASPQLQWRASFEAERLSAKAVDETFDRLSVGLGASYGFAGGLSLGVDVTQDMVRYDGLSPLFGVQRRDDITTIGARLFHREFQVGGFAPVLNLTHEVGKSSSALHTYDNTTVSIGLTREF